MESALSALGLLALLVGACGQRNGRAIDPGTNMHEDAAIGVTPTPRGDAGAYASGPCEGIPYLGRCEGSVSHWCEEDEPRELDCAVRGGVCLYTGLRLGYYCQFPSRDAGVRDGGLRDAGAGARIDAGRGGSGIDAAVAPGLPCGMSAAESEQFDRTNAERARAGVAALACDGALVVSARRHAEDMCNENYFSHRSLDGREFTDRMRDAGASFRGGGENIAQGQTSPAEVTQAWMNSSGHRMNILNGSFGRLGVGAAPCGGRWFWVQNFAD